MGTVTGKQGYIRSNIINCFIKGEEWLSALFQNIQVDNVFLETYQYKCKTNIHLRRIPLVILHSETVQEGLKISYLVLNVVPSLSDSQELS